MAEGADPYAPPKVDGPPTVAFASEEEAFEATKATGSVRLAAGLVAGVGLLLELSSIQLFGNFQLFGFAKIVAYGMIGFGGVFLFVATKLYRQRVWAAQLGLGLAALAAVAGAVWLLVLVGAGVISLYGFVLPPLSIATVVLVRPAVAQCRRATAARERLQRDGVAADF